MAVGIEELPAQTLSNYAATMENFRTIMRNLRRLDAAAGGGGGAVSSVFGRTGAVVAQSGDYTAAQVGAQPVDSDLTAIAALTTTSYGRGFLDRADALAARAYIGTVIGTDVQAFDSDLAAIAALATTAYGRSLLTVADATALRVLAGLVIGTDVQAFDSDLAAIAALSTTAFGRGLLTEVSAATARTTLDVPSNAEAVLDTLIDAKGDILAGTADNVITRLGVGADGLVLTAASGQPTGLQWAAAGGGGVTFGSVSGLEGANVDGVSGNASRTDHQHEWGVRNQVAASTTYTVPAGRQEMFAGTIDVVGTLDVIGELISVDEPTAMIVTQRYNAVQFTAGAAGDVAGVTYTTDRAAHWKIDLTVDISVTATGAVLTFLFISIGGTTNAVGGVLLLKDDAVNRITTSANYVTDAAGGPPVAAGTIIKATYAKFINAGTVTINGASMTLQQVPH